MSPLARALLPGLLLLGCKDSGSSDSGSSDSAHGWSLDGLEAGPVQLCDAPVERVSYLEVGASMGLGGSQTPDGPHLEGGTLAVLDLDDDGDLDVVLGFTDQALTLYRQVNGAFEAEALVSQVPPWGLSLGDVDADGDLDLLQGQWRPPGEMFVNQGGALTAQPLPSIPLARGVGVRELVPADLDDDGWLDLYAVVTGREDLDAELRRDFVLRGDGAGAFSSELEQLPADTAGRLGFDGLVLDREGDGDPDVYVVNDMGRFFGGNVLYDNQGGALTDASADCACGVVQDGMGADVADYDRDGLPDLYLSGATANHLLRGEVDGAFVDVTAATNASPPMGQWGMGWGSIWLDHDNDGWQDLLVAQGDLWMQGDTLPAFDSPITLLVQRDGVFEDQSVALGLDQAGSFRSAAAADFNGDGVLDLLVSDVTRPAQLYMSQGCTAPGWIEVEAPEGSRVQVSSASGVQVGWVTTQSGFGAAKPSVLHLGLGEDQQIDGLQVRLPDGAVVSVEGPMPARRRLTVSR